MFDWFPEWGAFKRYGRVAGSLIGSYKAPDIWLKNKVNKRTDAIRKGLPDALDLLVICAEAGLTVDAAFNRVARELGKAYPELGDEFALTAIELGFLTDRRSAFENLANRVDLEAVRGVVTTMIQTEKYGTPLASALRVLVGRVPQRADDARRGEGRAAAGDHDRAADPVHPADAVHRHPRPGGLLDLRQSVQVVRRRSVIRRKPGPQDKKAQRGSPEVPAFAGMTGRGDPTEPSARPAIDPPPKQATETAS